MERPLLICWDLPRAKVIVIGQYHMTWQELAGRVECWVKGREDGLSHCLWELWGDGRRMSWVTVAVSDGRLRWRPEWEGARKEMECCWVMSCSPVVSSYLSRSCRTQPSCVVVRASHTVVWVCWACIVVFYSATTCRWQCNIGLQQLYCELPLLWLFLLSLLYMLHILLCFAVSYKIHTYCTQAFHNISDRCSTHDELKEEPGIGKCQFTSGAVGDDPLQYKLFVHQLHTPHHNLTAHLPVQWLRHTGGAGIKPLCIFWSDSLAANCISCLH